MKTLCRSIIPLCVGLGVACLVFLAADSRADNQSSQNLNGKTKIVEDSFFGPNAVMLMAINQSKKPMTRIKGNNGVGNGEDPQPPGNPPINDGPGTGPGNPGNRPGRP